MNDYYTLLDARDGMFRLYGTDREIADYLLMPDALDIYEIDDALRRENDGLAGYYILELGR